MPRAIEKAGCIALAEPARPRVYLKAIDLDQGCGHPRDWPDAKDLRTTKSRKVCAIPPSRFTANLNDNENALDALAGGQNVFSE